MKALIFDVGTRVRISDVSVAELLKYNGTYGVVAKTLGTYKGRMPDGTTVEYPDCYPVTLLGGESALMNQSQLTLAPPFRRDMDTVVAWADMPYKRREEDLT